MHRLPAKPQNETNAQFAGVIANREVKFSGKETMPTLTALSFRLECSVAGNYQFQSQGGVQMTAAISFDSESEIVETGAASEVRIGAPAHTKFVKITEVDGTIRLIPFSLLSEAERAILENPDLYHQTIRGLKEFEAGERVSSDWLFDDDE